MNTSEVGIHAVKEGGKLALQYFHQRDNLTINLKGPQDYVSEADQNVEQTIKSIISEHYPDDGFIGEESGQSLGVRQWVIDPIDGTTNFLRGIPYFCTTLALVENEEVVAGWIYDPVHEQLYTAKLYEGAYNNTKILQPYGIVLFQQRWSEFVTAPN